MKTKLAYRLSLMALSPVIGVGLVALLMSVWSATSITSAMSESVVSPGDVSSAGLNSPAAINRLQATTSPWVKIIDHPIVAYQGQLVTVTVAWGNIPTDGYYKLRVQLENKLLQPDAYYAWTDILDYSTTGTRTITLTVLSTLSGVPNAFPRYGSRFVAAFISAPCDWCEVLVADYSSPRDVTVETDPPTGWTMGQFRMTGSDAGVFLDPGGNPFYAHGMVYAYENITSTCEQGRATAVISDLIRIKTMGFNTIRLYTPSGANSTDGLEQSDCMPEVLSWADLNHMALYVRVNYKNWVEYPDYMDSQYRQQAKDSLKDFLELARPHPSFLAVDLDQRWLFGVQWQGWYRFDVPHLMTETLAYLPTWLEDHYGTVDALNTAWAKHYMTFTDVLSDTEVVSNGQVVSLDRHPWRLDLVNYALWVMDDFMTDVISYARSIAPDHLYTYASDRPEVIPFPISTRASSGIDLGGPVHYSDSADYYRDWIARAKLTYETLWQRDLYGVPMFVDESGWRTTALPQPASVPMHGWSPTETDRAEFYLRQATLMGVYPWLPGWAYFKLYDKPEEGDWGFLNDDGTHRPIADLASCINPAILTNATGRHAPRLWVYYPKYALTTPYPAYEHYKTLIEVLEQDFFSAYEERVAETWSTVTWPQTNCAAITNTRLFTDLVDVFNERWQPFAFTATVPTDDLPILLAGRELESLSIPDRITLAQKRTVTFGPIGISDEHLRLTTPWYAQVISLTVPAPMTTSAECQAATSPTVNILSYPMTAYAGRSVDVAVEWCNLPPNAEQNYDLVVQLEDWRIGADALYLQWFHKFSQTGTLTVTLDVDVEHRLTYTQSITDARYVAAFVSKSCGWCDVLAVDATPANVTIQPRRWVTVTTSSGLTCPAWTGWTAHPITGTYRTLATFQGGDLDGQPAIVQSLDGRHTAFVYDALLWKSITSDLEKAKIEESLACHHALLDMTPPTVTAFTATSPSNSLHIPITIFTASDNLAVTGYKITESSTPPFSSAAGWTGSAPTSYTVGSDENYTLYPWAKDTAGNVSSVYGSPASVMVDTTAPTVSSSVRASASPTNASSVDFTVTFSESVSGVDTSDFSLTTTGVSSPSITGLSGSGMTYTATVNTGTGSGTIRLDVLDDDTIVDGVENTLNGAYSSGESYTIDKTAPMVSSSVRANSNPTNASSVDFTVTFSESVTGVDTSDFSLTTSGVTGASVTGVSGSGATYTATVSTGTGSGTIRLDVLDDDTIVDGVENTLNGAYSSGESYTIDKTAPSPTDTPTNMPMATNTPTNTPVATNTPTNTPMVTNTPTNTPVTTNTPTNTPVATNTPTNTPVGPTPTPAFTLYLPLVARNYPPLFYQWLSQQQDSTTGLLPSQQDYSASTYNNALAVMAFTLKGNSPKAKKILGYFNGKASEFFADNTCSNFSCSQSHLCGASAPCGFFQYRDSRTGVPFSNVNRWMGDNAWLLMAIHHYQAKTGDTSYSSMAEAIVYLLKSLQQPDGYIASGWENGDSTFNPNGHAEGNLDAYKALALYGETLAAQGIKDWLDFTNLNWEKGPLDLHSWRVLSLGKEYGFSLPETERTDDDAIRYKSTISYNGSVVTGHLPFPASEYIIRCQMNDNIWTEGTGQMAVAFYKAGYKIPGDFYTRELEKLLFRPTAFPDTQTISFLALPDPICHSWVDTSKGHVAAVTWYIFAKERFDPFDGVVINSFKVENPVARMQAENYDNSFGGVRLDGTGKLYEGLGVHIGGDNNVPANDSGWVEYKFNVIIPITLKTVSIRYADDVGGDTGKIFLDGNLIANFNTVDTGTWSDYIVTDFPIGPIQVQPCLHTLRLEVTDTGTYGFTVDHFQLSK